MLEALIIHVRYDRFWQLSEVELEQRGHSVNVFRGREVFLGATVVGLFECVDTTGLAWQPEYANLSESCVEYVIVKRSSIDPYIVQLADARTVYTCMCMYTYVHVQINCFFKVV